MKVLPFFLKRVQGQLQMVHLSLFLSNGGRTLWQTDEASLSQKDLEREYLLLNGLIPSKVIVEKDTAFVQIDPTQTKLADFYSWEEAYKHPQKPECWRSFYFFKDSTGADWFTPTSFQTEAEIAGTPVQKYYEDILRLFKD